MASHCYLSGPPAELFVEYLVHHCATTEDEVIDFKASKEVTGRSGPFLPFQYKKLEVSC